MNWRFIKSQLYLGSPLYIFLICVVVFTPGVIVGVMRFFSRVNQLREQGGETIKPCQFCWPHSSVLGTADFKNAMNEDCSHKQDEKRLMPNR